MPRPRIGRSLEGESDDERTEVDMPPAHRPDPPPAARRPRRSRLALAAALVPLLLLLLGVATAAAAPGTLRVIDMSPTLGRDVSVAAPGGGTFTADPGAALVRVTDAAGAVTEATAWCVDAQRAIGTGTDYPVDLGSSADDPGIAGPAGPEAAWLISRAGALIAGAPSPGAEAAAIQVAVWQLTGQAADIGAVTSDAALNARVAALRALAAGRAPATALALSGPAAATPGAPAVLTVTGTPGTDVALRVVSGQATLATTAVTLGAGGSAQVALTPAGIGAVVVEARADGGVLWRASHLPGRREPQDMAWVAPVPLVATTTLTALAPVAPLAPVAAVPIAPARPVAVPAALRLVKRAPATRPRGRAVGYTLTVTNTSRRVARAVVVRDPLPEGTWLPAVPGRARVAAGVVTWRLGDMAPGARVTLRLRLRTLRSAPTLLRNEARASAANAATVRARATTRLHRPAVAPISVPPVTG